MTASHVVPLSAEEPLAVVGGKGKSSGHLRRAGFTVPDGLVLTTPAYRDFIAPNEIQDRLETLARPEIRSESLTFAPAADRIARLFADSRIPKTATSALREACDEPGTCGIAMAVLPSATAEDLPEHSFAGHDAFTTSRATIPKPSASAGRRPGPHLWTAAPRRRPEARRGAHDAVPTSHVS